MDGVLLELSPNLLTGGQPTAEQLRDVARLGYQTVINLALHDADYSLPDEFALVESLGMRYYHIPVVWKLPRFADYQRFVSVMHQQGGRRVFVHCAANKRVSIFIALYRVCELDWDQAEAWADVLKVWEPDALWREFYVEVLQTAGTALLAAPESE